MLAIVAGLSTLIAVLVKQGSLDPLQYTSAIDAAIDEVKKHPAYDVPAYRAVLSALRPMSYTTGTTAARPRPPQRDEDHQLAGAAGFRDQGKANIPDCADHLAGDQPGAIDCKRFASLRARLALAGWGLIRTDPSDGAPIYFATRWNMPRELADLAAVEAFADRVGAPR